MRRRRPSNICLTCAACAGAESVGLARLLPSEATARIVTKGKSG